MKPPLKPYRILFPINYHTLEQLFYVEYAKSLPVYDPETNSQPTYKFGGIEQGTINQLYYFIRFDTLPTDLGITSLKSLTLGFHARSFDALNYQVFYEHDENGYPSLLIHEANQLTELPQDEDELEDSFEPIIETEIILEPITQARDAEEWGLLNQVGGTPLPKGMEDYQVLCPVTGDVMQFLLSVTCQCSPAIDDYYGFYSEGTFYVYWSDVARISAVYYTQS